jgi:hypothetical protein
VSDDKHWNPDEPLDLPDDAKCDGCGETEFLGNLACCSHCGGLFCPDCCHSWRVAGGDSGATCEACVETIGRQQGGGP